MSTGDETLRRRADEITFRRSGQETLRRGERLASSGVPGFFGCFAGNRHEQLMVTGHLARGGEGDVYLCRGREGLLAVKVLGQASDAQVLRALERSQDILRDSPLVPLLYVGSMRELPGQVADTRPYLVSPYYAAGDLTRLANRQRINPSARSDSGGENPADPARTDELEFSRLTRQLHEAIKILHRGSLMEGSSIVHRDIRPQNVLVDADGSYRLGDYGLASVLENTLAVKLTRRFGISHGYSPPEAYASERLRQQVSRKYDYFSLGMTLLYAALGGPRYRIAPEGRTPGEGEISAADFYEIIALSNVQIPQSLPERIRLLIRGLTLASPEHRWGEVEVDSWLAGGSPAVHRPSIVRGSGISVRVQGTEYSGDEEVAGAILKDWDFFRTLVSSGELVFSWHDPDLAARHAVEEAVAQSRSMDPETGLRDIVRRIRPDLGHVFYGRSYPTDEALGRAMMQADPAETELFAAYLAGGGLRGTGGILPDTAQAEAVRMLESYAAIEPQAAVDYMGRLLTGTPLPKLRVPLSGGDTLICSLDELTEEVAELTAGMLHSYIALTSASMPELTPVPGLYGAAQELCVVQPDGTVVADPAPLSAPMPVPERLADILRYITGGRTVHSVSDLEPRLFVSMHAEGWIREGADLQSGSAGGHFRFTLPEITALLSIFPDFRERHRLDASFQEYFAHVRRLLDGCADLVLPRGGGAGGGPVNAARQAAKEAMAEFERTERWTDLVRAADMAAQSLATVSSLAPAVHAAAVRLARTFDVVFAGTDSALHAEFDRAVQSCRSPERDPGALARLTAAMDRLAEKAKQQLTQSLGRYALSPEMQFIRDLSRQRPEAVDFVVPDTLNADQYYAELRRWAAGRMGKDS